MTALVVEGQAPRRNANLGAPDEEEIFASFDTRIIRRFFAFLAPHRALLIGAQVAVLISSVTNVAVPWVIGSAVNAAVAHDTARLRQRLAVFGILVLLNAATNFCDQWMTSRLAQRVIFDVRRAMFAHFQDVALTFMDKTHVGRIMSRLQGDVNALQEFLESSTGALGDFATLFGYAVVLVWMDWRLGLLTLTTIPALIVIRAVWLPYSKRTFRRARDASSVANGALAENINGVRTVQESRREALNFELYEEKARENFDAQVASAWLAQIMTPTVDVLTGVAMAFIIVVGGNEALGGGLAVGVLVTFILSVQRFFEPVRLLSMQYTVMQRAMAAGHRIFEVLDVPVTVVDRPGAVRLGDEEATIELDHVTFGYAPGRPVLHDVSLNGEAAQCGCARGSHGIWQDQHRSAGAPVLRRGRGRREGRWPRRAGCDVREPRRLCGHGAAGAISLLRNDRGEHPLQHRPSARATMSSPPPRRFPPMTSSCDCLRAMTRRWASGDATCRWASVS